MTKSLQGYSTASDRFQPTLEYPPRHVPPVLEYPPMQQRAKESPDSAPRAEDIPLMLLLAATRGVTAESVVEAMHSEINPFTTRAHSPPYKSLLEKRLQLPVYAQLQKFCTLFSQQQILIVTGGTGCGKTTQIPHFVAYCDFPQVRGKMIAITQPRRVTTVSVARRVADEMDVELGKEVGYSVRFDDKTTPGVTFLRYMTDGKLLHEAMYDPDFSRYSTIIIDEAHERTIATDILMALLKSVVKKRRDLRVIIMSATLDAPTFQQYFSLDDGATPARLLNIPGRSYPVDVLHLRHSDQDYVQKAIEVVMRIHAGNEPGDILLFLTGEDEIEMACRKMRELVNRSWRRNPNIGPLDCIPLYSLLPPEKQQRIFDPPPKPRKQGGRQGRKVIVATNIAETSLTIDGIYFVIDCGFAKQKVYIPRTRMNYLRSMRISKASAQQRVGRAGRTGPGKCYRLYTADDYEAMVEKTRPEVMNIDLSDDVLKLLNIGIKAEDLTNFDFIDAPAPARIAFALETLGQLGAVDRDKCITELGRMMVEFPLDARVSKALLESVKLKSFEQMLTIAAMLSVQSVWRRPLGKEQLVREAKARLTVEGGDHLTLLNVYDQYVKHSCDANWAKKNYVCAHTLEEATKVREQLQDMLEKRYQVQTSTTDGISLVRSDVQRALAAGFYMQVACRDENGMYVRVKDNDFVKLHPSCRLKRHDPPKWIMYDEVIRNRDPCVRTVTEVNLQWLLEIAPEYYKPETFPDGPAKTELQAALGCKV